jgi:DASS family divalent anion:Na+ symporter
MICVSQIDAIVCTMFLTAMAGNPLVAELARSQGIEITWTTWFVGAIVPGIASLILLPLVIYAIYPPQLKKTPEIPAIARKSCAKWGRCRWQKNSGVRFCPADIAMDYR